MPLPEYLQEAIQMELDSQSWSGLYSARGTLSHKYQQQEHCNKDKERSFITSDEERAAYLAVRFPATYGVASRVLEELKMRSNIAIRSLLDLGSGPGTFLFACQNKIPELKKATMVEYDASLVSIGKRLLKQSPHATEVSWVQGNVEQMPVVDSHDIVAMSYSLGEIPQDKVKRLLETAWNLANEALMIIEPGTPYGFRTILKARNLLSNLGGHMIAPCPHFESCPLQNGNDWCHFSQRIERTSLHRRLKEGSLGYEDEKFSYIIIGKKPCVLPEMRILRHPQQHSGHIGFVLCSQQGIKEMTISKRHGELYRVARKAEWGDCLGEK